MKFSVIKEKEFIRSTWSGGTTEQIFIYPADAVFKDRDFLFRISRASVDISPSEFTQLPGIRRFIMPLNNELALTHDGITDIKLKPFEAYEFSGEIDTTSKSSAKDFNLMLAKGVRGDMRSVSLEAGKQFIYRPAESPDDMIQSEESLENEGAEADPSEYKIEDGKQVEKHFTGFYTPDIGVIIKDEDIMIDLPANSLFLSESDSEITLISEMNSYIIMINVWI